MFSLLSVLIHIINSVFSGIYTSQFLKSKQNPKTTIILWSIVYFIFQVVIQPLRQSSIDTSPIMGSPQSLLCGVSSQGRQGGLYVGATSHIP